jgi:YVTN family beta-propeller protein
VLESTGFGLVMKIVNKNYIKVYAVIFLAIISQLILLLSVIPQTNSVKLSEKALETVLNLGSTSDTNYHIPTGKEPLYIQLVYKEKEVDKESLFVSNLDSDTVSIFDVDNDTKIAQDISIDQPRDMEVNNYTNVLYVISSATNTVTKIDGSNNTKLNGDIRLDEHPISLAIDSNNNTSTLYVTISKGDKENGNVSIINGSNGTVMKSINVQLDPRAIEFDKKNERLYIANNRSDTVSVIDISNDTMDDWKVVHSISVGKNPQAIGIYNDSWILVANTGSNTVSAINTIDENISKWKVEKNIKVGEGPRAIAKYDDERFM